mgnify:CR=1 FL=1
MAVSQIRQRRLFRAASIVGAPAAPREAAGFFRLDGRGDFTLEYNPFLPVMQAGNGDRREQRPRVRMQRIREKFFGGRLFYKPAKIHHRNVV